MAFVRKKVGSYKWPVKIETPLDGGSFEIQRMTVEFKRITQTQIEKFKDNKELLNEVIVGWSEYKDEKGVEIPFSTEELGYLVEDTTFLRAAGMAFFESLSGAKPGN